MDGLGDILKWVFLLGCVLPLVVMLVLAVAAFYFGRRWVEEFVEPDVGELEAKYEAMRAKAPNTATRELIDQVIHAQALKCGVVGAVTGLGGFITLPVALPIDMLLSARYQASMVSFIAQAYGYQGTSENKMATYAVMTGTTEVTKAANQIVLKYVPTVIGKLSSKLVPIVGAILGFGVNYALARSMGMVAMRWYENKPKAEILQAQNTPPATA